MKKLWKYTFHDSDDYINMIFDSYFNPDYIIYEEKEGKLIAALLAIPQTFSLTIQNNNHSHCNYADSENEAIVNENKNKKMIRGLYLCGLATLPEYRRGGVMTRMIEEINMRAVRMGFSFTFLIPANHELIGYYQNRGYFVSSFRRIERYLTAHDFKNDYNLLRSKVEILHDSYLKSNEVEPVIKNNTTDYNKNISEDSCKNILDWEDLVCVSLKEIIKNISDKYYENYIKLIKDRLDFYHYIKCFIVDLFTSVIYYKTQQFSFNYYTLKLQHSAEDWKNILKDNLDYEGNVYFIIHKDDYKIFKNILLNLINNSESINEFIHNASIKSERNIYNNTTINLPSDNFEIQNLTRLIRGIGYVYQNDERNGVEVRRLDVVSKLDKLRVLGKVAEENLERNEIKVLESPSVEENYESWSPYGEQGFSDSIADIVRDQPLVKVSDSCNLEPYTMMRLLNPFDVLDFVAWHNEKMKYSILMHWDKSHLDAILQNCKNIRDKIGVEYLHNASDLSLIDYKIFEELDSDLKDGIEKSQLIRYNRASFGKENVISKTLGRDNFNIIKEWYLVNLIINDRKLYFYLLKEIEDIYAVKRNYISNKYPGIPPLSQEIFSLKNIGEILFGRPVKNHIVDEAFILPRISVEISLMLE